MLTPKRIALISYKQYGGSSSGAGASGGVQFAGGSVYVDTEVVLPGSHWIVLAATIELSAAAGAMKGMGFGGQNNGIFICPNGTGKPQTFGNITTLPFRAPTPDPYQLNNQGTAGTGLFSFQDGPSFLPITKSDSAPAGDTCTLFFNGPFYVDSNSFLRGIFSGGNNIAAVNGIGLQMRLQLIEEANNENC